MDFPRILARLGVPLEPQSAILDFGCGAGETVDALRAQGYVNTVGYDVTDGPTLLTGESGSKDYITTGTLLDLRLPYEDNSFDLVISDQVFEHVKDQVRVFSELYRVTKPGGHGLHIWPARYSPIEPHMLIPFGGFFVHRWWYKLWAALGIRNMYQKGLSADETADRNIFFAVEALCYLPNSCYRVMWKRLGFEARFAERAFFEARDGGLARRLARLPIGWLYRTFRARVVYLYKPVHAAGVEPASAVEQSLSRAVG